jgi:hypothetical protein
MKRAAVIIGIDKTGDLPKLNDAARGAQLMEKWAREQGMDSVYVLTDTEKPVDASAIKNAIKKLVDAANIGQLVVYFAGHGVNRQRHEYWLLSDAPDDPNAAVNVAGSVGLAATCGIPHIVLISDACRTAAEGIRAQTIEGQIIFPNREGDEKPVDQFFACRLGQPSHEVKDPTVSSAEFKALYTNELVPALLGRRPQIVEWTTERNQKVGLIRLRPLRDFMSLAIKEKLNGLQLQTKLIQDPIAQINSDPPEWISRVSESAIDGSLGIMLGGLRAPITPAATAATIADSLLRSALAADPSELQTAFDHGRSSGIAGASEIVSSAELISRPFGPTHHETKCGFKIRGARIVATHARNAIAELVVEHSPLGEDVRVDRVIPPGASVLLVLEDGAGIVLSAIPGFLAALTLEEGELVDVAYEPSINSWRWDLYESKAREIRSLRAIVSSSITRGVFKLEGDTALEIAKRMQYGKGVDPSLAIYAAYGYHDLQRPDLIREMITYMQDDLGATLFDVALLARALNGQTVTPESNLLSPVPLLSQSWALLPAYKVSLPPILERLEDTLTPSVWTMFDKRGVELVRRAIDSGAIR